MNRWRRDDRHVASTKQWLGGVLIVGLLLSTAACSTAKGLTTTTTPGHSKPAGAIAITSAERPSTAAIKACATHEPATWMGCVVRADPDFGRFPISGLSIPGSRNGGTYNLDPASFDSQSGSSCASFSSGDAKLGSEFARWSETQNETITEQLNQGIRWVDLQVAYNGDGSPTKGWRVVQSLYSQFPLYDYLDQIAIWASAHPTELVVVDLSRVCYSKDLSSTLADGLWANFVTPSDLQAGSTTIQKVAFNPGTAGVSLANATIDQVAQPDHNVVVLVPGNVVGLTTRSAGEVHPIVVAEAGNSAAPASPSRLQLEASDPQIAPTTASAFPAANMQLEDYPIATKPALGSLVGKGLYVTRLAYSVTLATQALLFAHFGGLIAPVSVGSSPASHLAAWEANLWEGTAPRNRVLAAWGHRANVVLADGVQYGGFVEAVVGLNAA
jgi:hypothetical protein